MEDKNNKRISINLFYEITNNDSDIDLYYDNINIENLSENSKMSIKNAEAITLEKDQSFDNFDHSEKHKIMQNIWVSRYYQQVNPEKPGKSIRNSCQW
ncbi:13054_t:CDS:2, partial [Dentiscutata erythropus]